MVKTFKKNNKNFCEHNNLRETLQISKYNLHTNCCTPYLPLIGNDYNSDHEYRCKIDIDAQKTIRRLNAPNTIKQLALVHREKKNNNQTRTMIWRNAKMYSNKEIPNGPRVYCRIGDEMLICFVNMWYAVKTVKSSLHLYWIIVCQEYAN